MYATNLCIYNIYIIIVTRVEQILHILILDIQILYISWKTYNAFDAMINI